MAVESLFCEAEVVLPKVVPEPVVAGLSDLFPGGIAQLPEGIFSGTEREGLIVPFGTADTFEHNVLRPGGRAQHKHIAHNTILSHRE